MGGTYSLQTIVLSIAATIVGAGLVFVTQSLVDVQPAADANQLTIQRADPAERNIYGSPRADTVIVEFSDFQCPFCAQLHGTLKQLVDESEGSVAWEYRHLPLQNHRLAAPTAAVAECVKDAQGNEAFWQFTDLMFERQSEISQDFVQESAANLGVSIEQQTVCLEDDDLVLRLERDVATAMALGGAGTPFSVIIYPDQTYKAVSGALPYEQWQELLQP